MHVLEGRYIALHDGLRYRADLPVVYQAVRSAVALGVPSQ